MLQKLIESEQFVENIMWVLFTVLGLFFLFLLVGLIMLTVIKPRLPEHMRPEGWREKP